MGNLYSRVDWLSQSCAAVSEALPPNLPSPSPFTGVGPASQLEASPCTLQPPLPLIRHRHFPQWVSWISNSIWHLFPRGSELTYWCTRINIIKYCKVFALSHKVFIDLRPHYTELVPMYERFPKLQAVQARAHKSTLIPLTPCGWVISFPLCLSSLVSATCLIFQGKSFQLLMWVLYYHNIWIIWPKVYCWSYIK